MSTNARIVVDARMATDGGIGTYLQQLVPRIAALRPDWQLCVIGDERKMRDLGWARLPQLRLVHSSARIFSIREQMELPILADGSAGLFWSPNYNIPLFSRLPRVVTIHDVNHVALPELMGNGLRRGYARWLLHAAVRRARRVLFVSEFTRQEAIRLVGGACADGRVVHLGVDETWTRARARSASAPTAGPYFLYVGNIKRHKNVPFLLRAFGRIMDQVPHRLVLIGRTAGLRTDPLVAPTLRALGDRAELLGEVDADTLARYMAHADALVTASLYEGFGLPALEAMAAGTPCLVSNAGSLPEICGDAALFADPTDEESFAAALVRMARDRPLRESLIARGRERASAFSWDRSAAETAAVLDEALGPRSGLPSVQ